MTGGVAPDPILDTDTRVSATPSPAADDRKGDRPARARTSARSRDFTDYFLICSGTSERQVQAIADGVEETAARREACGRSTSRAHRRAQWVLLDFGDFVVHVFQEEPRRFYGLERLWGDAPDVTDDFRARARHGPRR